MLSRYTRPRSPRRRKVGCSCLIFAGSSADFAEEGRRRKEMAISFFVQHSFPSYALCKAARSNFFIGRNACVIRSTCSRVPFFIISPIVVGQTCQERPNLSFSQPHCSACGSAESFSQ